MFRPMSPGRSCAVAKTMMLSRTSVTSASPRRLTMYRVMAQAPGAATLRRGRRLEGAGRPVKSLAQRPAPELETPEALRLVTLHLGRARCDVVVEVRKDDRRVPQQDALDLLGVLPLRREVRRGDEGLHR